MLREASGFETRRQLLRSDLLLAVLLAPRLIGGAEGGGARPGRGVDFAAVREPLAEGVVLGTVRRRVVADALRGGELDSLPIQAAVDRQSEDRSMDVRVSSSSVLDAV